jgi:cytochrome P450
VHEIPGDFVCLPEPERVLAALMADGPVQRVRMHGQEFWLVTGHEEVLAGLSSPDLYINETAVDGGTLLDHSLLATDPPDHTRLRRSVSRVFTARRVAGMRPGIQRIADELLDAIEPAGQAELMAEFALPLPVTVICELLGIPVADRRDFERQAVALILPPAPEEVLARAAAAEAELQDYFTDLIARKRAQPADDLLSALATDAELSDRELCAMAAVLVLAGHETTANLIGTGTLTLLRHPDQLAAIRDDPALLPGAVEELARYAGPISLGVNRYTRAGMLLAGQRIPAGEPVVFALAAAGRDPSCYGRPEVLDVKRAQGVQLAFGHGIHFCLGAPLARLEATVALGTLLRRLPGLALPVPASQLTWRLASTRGLAALPVTFTPAHNHGGVPRRG